MEFAIVNGIPETPKPKLAGSCVCCGNAMIAKCGPKVMWHWAHITTKHCDPWWENETEWHRCWKACFPASWRERIHFDLTGEKHIADVKTLNGIVIEFQNSPMSHDELKSREFFYQNMVWIVNGLKFANNLHILGRLPRPDAPWVDDIVFRPQRRDWYGCSYWRKSKNPEPTSGVEVHSLSGIQSAIDLDYVGHHFYDWVKPHTVWLAATKPVYLDLGGDLLWLLEKYGDRDQECIRAVKKTSLISLHGGTYTATGVVVTLPGRKKRPYMLEQNQDCQVLLDSVS